MPELPEKGRRTAFFLYLAGDIVYMTLFTFFVSVFLFHANHSQVRLFLITGGMTGFLVYRVTLGRLVMAVSEMIVRCLKRLWSLLVWRPLLWLSGGLWRILRTIATGAARLGILIWQFGPGRLVSALRRSICRMVCQRRLNRCIRRLPDTMKL